MSLWKQQAWTSLCLWSLLLMAQGSKTYRANKRRKRGYMLWWIKKFWEEFQLDKNTSLCSLSWRAKQKKRSSPAHWVISHYQNQNHGSKTNTLSMSQGYFSSFRYRLLLIRGVSSFRGGCNRIHYNPLYLLLIWTAVTWKKNCSSFITWAINKIPWSISGWI